MHRKPPLKVDPRTRGILLNLVRGGAIAFLGESLNWLHWLGGALIVAGAVLLARA